MIRKHIFGAALALGLLGGFGAAHAAGDWLDSKLKNRREIAIRPDAAGLDAKTAVFPFALRLSEQNINFADVKPDGSDLRVAGPNGKAVDHFVESIDREAGLAVIWVKGADLEPSKAQTYQLYYGGDAKAKTDSQAVFDKSERLFLDFSGPGRDRTSNNNNPATAAAAAAGFAGQSANLTGAAIRIPASESLASQAGQPVTVMMWVKPAQDGVLARRAGLQLSLTGGMLVAQVGGAQVSGTAPVAPGKWSHVALVAHASGQVELFVDGKLAGAGQAQTPALNDDLMLGEGFIGQLDNVRYVSGERSAGYIAAVAQSDAGRGLVTFGGEQVRSGKFELGYFTTVITNVTIEGWVVIGLCGIMLALAIWVMITKSGLVSRIEKQNAVFRRAYTGADALENGALRDAARGNEASTLSQIYAVGMHEVESRAQSGRRFSGAAMEALRARVDEVLTNQSAKLSERMVLLTLAISGGPFLGLLGTVIGVMITFAAIAAEGNVNVNSIAPGVAAALLATAAGLMVAIPALFAYNMILTRIKRINATSRSFADALVARLAEQHEA